MERQIGSHRARAGRAAFFTAAFFTAASLTAAMSTTAAAEPYFYMHYDEPVEITLDVTEIAVLLSPEATDDRLADDLAGLGFDLAGVRPDHRPGWRFASTPARAVDGASLEAVVAEVAARDAAGVMVAEAFMIVHHPQWQLVRDWIAGGKIGELRHVRGAFSFDNSADGGNIRNRVETGGGALRDIGVYVLGAARFATGRRPNSPATSSVPTA